MTLNLLEKQIEQQAKFEMHRVRDPYKSFFDKSIMQSDEAPTLIMQGLLPKCEYAVERRETTDLHNPGEYCYRNMAISTGSSKNPTVVFTKKVMMNCPFCNKPQFLYNNDKIYDGKPDSRMFLQKWINNVWPGIFPWSEQLTGTLTVKGPITCHFNKLHRWTVIKNKIAFFYPKSLIAQ